VSKVKGKERILITVREKTSCYVQSNPHKAISSFISRNLAGQKKVAQYMQSTETTTIKNKTKKNPSNKNTLPAKVIQN